MKKFTKSLALFLTVVVLISSFSIMSGAISSKSTAKELLDYYENCIITTSAKEDVIKAENYFKDRELADYSTLKGKDLAETKAFNKEYGYYDGYWHEWDSDYYYYCDAYEEYYWEGRSQYVDYFSIKRDIRRFDLDFESAKYSKSENGVVTLIFVYSYADAEYEDCTSVYTYTVKINKNGYLEFYSLEKVENNTDYSIDNNPYKVNYESVDTYTFVYNKVKVKSFEMSEEKVVLGRDETCDIILTINPDNATYNDYRVDYDMLDLDVASVYVEDDVITISANNPGETVLTVYAYGGDAVASCEIVVEYSSFDNFMYQIASFFDSLRAFFVKLLLGF